jgi:RHS repeat-associated protein
MAYTYDADDRLGSDQYDANVNTTSSFGVASAYDFENHMVQKGAVTIVYDGDGNRVSETVGGVTTSYLVDTQNPTGYAQVVDELQSGAVGRTYSYGLERISEKQLTGISFYGYDGHGSVRQLTNSAGAVTDSYDYDAFGNLTSSTGSTPNNYLFAGEDFDPALGLYYNRARYLNTTTGRFWIMDAVEGNAQDPASLHIYTYSDDNPVNNTDPSGNEVDAIGAFSVAATLDVMPNLNAQGLVTTVKNTIRDNPNDLWLVADGDAQTYGRRPTFWSPGSFPDRSILYVVGRKDGKPLNNPSYNWTISEHQSDAALASGPNGTSSQDGGRFCDELSPRFSKIPIQSDQHFTISPQPGTFNPANENDDVIVHTGNGDFGTLGIWMDWDAVTINGLKAWAGAANYACTQ